MRLKKPIQKLCAGCGEEMSCCKLTASSLLLSSPRSVCTAFTPTCIRAPQPSLARGPRRATGPRTTMICVQRRHSETEHLRPIPGRRDVRHSDSPFGARPLHWARNRWAHDEPNANAKRGPPPFEPLIAPRGDTAARPTTPKQRRHACVGSAWRVRSRLDCAVSLPVTPGVYSAEKCVICRETRTWP